MFLIGFVASNDKLEQLETVIADLKNDVKNLKYELLGLEIQTADLKHGNDNFNKVKFEKKLRQFSYLKLF